MVHYEVVASNYRYMEYYQLRQYVLSVLEPLQTKVVNFVESGLQNEKGRLIFSRRNHHNQQPIGTGALFCTTSKDKTTFYSLKLWKDWKTSLVIDHAR